MRVAGAPRGIAAVALLTLLAGAATAKSPPAGTASAPGPSPAVTQASPRAPARHPPSTPTAAASAPTPALTRPATPLATQAKVAKPKPKSKLKAKRKRKPKPPPVPKLTGWLSAGSVFPARTLVLSTAPTNPLDGARLHLSENGSPVGAFTVTALARPAPRDFGVVLVIDQSLGMSGDALGRAMAAARKLAEQRTGAQELGMITFDSQPTSILPLTSDPKAIARVLATTPWIAPGADVPSALALAYRQLARARIAAGAVILISNGSQQQPSTEVAKRIDGLTDTPAASGVQLFSIALHVGRYDPGAASKIAKAAGATLLQASGAQLNQAAKSIWTTVAGGDLVRYRSGQSRGRPVLVSVRADRIPAALTLNYTPAVIPRPPPPPAPRRVTAPVPHNPAVLSPLPAAAPARASFWSGPMAVPAVALICALLLGLAIAVLLGRQPSQTPHMRVGQFIPEASAKEAAEEADHQRAGLLGLFSKRRWWPAFVEQVQAGRIQRSPQDLVRRTIALTVLAALAMILVAGSPVLGILVFIPAPFLLRFYVRRAGRRQRVRFADELPSHLQDLSGAMRAGRSFVGGIAAVAESSVEPIRGELERALTDEQLGAPLEDTLQAIGRRMQSDEMEQVALVAGLHRRSGSNVAEALNRVAEGARERADLRREFASLTAQARLSSRVLAGLPPMLLIALNFVDPAYERPMFHTLGGIVVLVICSSMVVAGWFVMKKIANVEV